MARFVASRPLFIKPEGGCLRLIEKGEEFTMSDSAPASLDWLPLDDSARAAIASEQQRYLKLRGGDANGYSAWGCALPGDTMPPITNWPPPPTPAPARPLGKSRIARHNRTR